MATDKGATQAPGGKPPADPLIRTFLSSFEQLVDGYGRSIQARVSEPDARAMAEHFTGVLKAQANRLATFVTQSYEQAAPTKRAEVDQLLARQAAVELSQGAATLAPNVSSLQAFKGLSDIIGLIKKIIKFILRLIFGGKTPEWLNDLIDLIDEIVGALGGVFSLRLQRDINLTEIEYTKAMFHLQRLNMLEQSGDTSDDNEDR